MIGDPSYFPGKCRRVGQVVRALCILSHPIPNCGESHSVQIILPQKQTGRQTDMYVFGCSWVGPTGGLGGLCGTHARGDIVQNDTRRRGACRGFVDADCAPASLSVLYCISRRQPPLSNNQLAP